MCVCVFVCVCIGTYIYTYMFTYFVYINDTELGQTQMILFNKNNIFD